MSLRFSQNNIDFGNPSKSSFKHTDMSVIYQTDKTNKNLILSCLSHLDMNLGKTRENIDQILVILFHFMHAPENISSATDNGITNP